MSRGLACGRIWRAVLVLVLFSAPAAAGEQAPDTRAAGSARPAALVPLYVAFVGLQAIDAHSTFAALDAGAREANPMVRGAVGNPAGMFLLKAGTAAGVVVLTERLWPHNRTAAVLTMIALNSAYATIAAHNYRTGVQR